MNRDPPGIAAATTSSSANWSLVIFPALFLTITSALAAAQTGKKGMNPAETWVVAQATAGEIADLSKQFREEKDRKLRAHFLEELLTGALSGFKPHRNGVRIIGAIIDEPISLANAQIPCEVRLYQCQFNQSVIFARANFAGGLFFNGSKFKEAIFNSMKVVGDADFGAYFGMNVRGAPVFDPTVFEEPVYFIAADIGGNLRAQNAKFKHADFSRIKVRGDRAVFDRAEFDGPVNFFQADIAQFFAMSAATFCDEAYFFGIKVGGNPANFSSTEFHAAAYFNWSDIAGDFQAFAAKFHNRASFEKLKLANDAIFDRTEFDGPGPVNFSQADIAGNFKAQNAKFWKYADFTGIKIGHSAFFSNAIFKRPVNFLGADVAGDF
jgi:uncharacterized protein YjbI with pentapeptide repeats